MEAVDPLERTCTEVVLSDAAREQAPPATSAPEMLVRDLAEMPAFVLLGEPGMGKTQTMQALARSLSVGGQYITADHFLVAGASHHSGDEHHLFIDALDEVRISGDSTVWRELRTALARSHPPRFGLSCRAADWQATDKEDLVAAVHGTSVRVFALNPLTPDQRRAVLEHEGVANIEAFEAQAELLGFSEMLGNPQSLKLLAAAVKSKREDQQDSWPKTRRDAYEMACHELVKEENLRHQQAQKKSTRLSHEDLLDAAGWLCALMLLSNSHEVSDETPRNHFNGSVWLDEVLDTFPQHDRSAAVQQVMRRPLFTKRHGHAPVHRTVAEYLAARHIDKQIREGGLQPGRIASLMLASPKHLVSNLRGLAGWLAALSERMRSAIFEADPAAVLNYGDLHLLPTSAKQLLIEQLVKQDRVQIENSLWQQAASHTPLVEPDMRSFVRDWLVQFGQTVSPTPQQAMVAYVLLNALATTATEHSWESTLLGLVRAEHVAEGIREAALVALNVHKSSPEVSLTLLEDLHEERLHEPRKRLTEQLLQDLYPDSLRPSKVLRFLAHPRAVGQGFVGFSNFWQYRIQKATSDDLLPELMDALEQVSRTRSFTEKTHQIEDHNLVGLGALVVKYIEQHGTGLSASKLSHWLWLCYSLDDSPLRLDRDSAVRLTEWLHNHPQLIQPVMTHWLREGRDGWAVQNKLPSESFPPGMGAFWLEQAQAFQAQNATAQVRDCLENAVWWMDQTNSGITLDNLVAVAEQDPVLKEIIESLLQSPLDNNVRRKHWLSNQQLREQVEAKRKQSEKNLRSLLDHLEDVRSGKLLKYLNDAAWQELRHSGYGGMQDGMSIEEWRNQHPELDEATRQGHLALLYQLTSEQAGNAIRSRNGNQIWNFELPCLVAAQHLYAQAPEQFLLLGKERLQALVTLYLLHHSANSDWLLALVDDHPTWVEEVWWTLGAQVLRSKAQIRIPHLAFLEREPKTRQLALRLLPRFLMAWPGKFSELSFPDFLQLLEATLRTCPPTAVGDLVVQRLRKKSLNSLQRSYLLMAGLWVAPAVFAPMMDRLLHKKQIVQSELLGFIGHLGRYGGRPDALPDWDAATMAMLFRLFAPLCPSAYPTAIHSANAQDAGRSFLYQILSALRNDTAANAQHALQKLLADDALSEWQTQVQDALARQAHARAEKAFALPTARQVALVLQNKTPANPADLMAVGVAALKELQKEIDNSPANLINGFWQLDQAGKRPIPEHLPEPQCRNVIVNWLKPRLTLMGVSVDPEHQHGAQNQSDIVLRVQTVGQTEMILPIEVKGDWNQGLRTAPHQQLALKYASDPRCHGKGIYLVLWLGANRGTAARPKQHANLPAFNAADFQKGLQLETDQRTRGMNMDIQVFVLDVSIHRTET